MARIWPRFGLRFAIGVIAVLGVILALTVASQRSSEAAERRQCRSNLLQIGLGLTNYAMVNDAFPLGTVPNEGLPPERRLSWLSSVFSYFEQLFWILRWTEAWDSPSNCPTRARGVEGPDFVVGRVDVFVCPAAAGARDEHMPGWTWYVGIAGVGTDAPALPLGHPRAGIFGHDRPTRPSDIRDGASHTLLLAETDLANGPWTAGGQATARGLDPGRQPYIGPKRQFGGLHHGGVYVALADGSVRFLADSIDPKVLEALATVAGGETLPSGWDR